ncbi:MAG TPA: DUF3710 domain-containing protein [Micromonosporaceae bacterium]
MKFSRGGGGGGRHSADDPRRSGRHSHGPDGEPNTARDAVGPATPRRSRSAESAASSGIEPDGPYDSADAPSGVQLLDFGSIQVPADAEVELGVQDTGGGVIQQIILKSGGSALLLVAFAAPRTEPIWDEVRGDFRESLFADGVAVEEVNGAWGRALRARVRSAEGMMDLRFVGIDGPRWMLRAVFQGPAAVDPESCPPLTRSLRGLVINRGRDAMPAKEALPLTYPREHVEAMRAAAAGAALAEQQAAAQPEPVAPPVAPPAPAVGPPSATGRGSHRAPEEPSDSYRGGGYATAPAVGGTVYGSTPEYGTSPFDTGSPFGSDQGVNGNGRGTYSGGRNGNGAAIPDEAPARRRPSPRPRRSE